MEPVLDLHDCLHLCSASFALHLENILIFEDVPFVECMYLVFTHMPGGELI